MKVTRDDLIHDRIPEGLLVVKVVLERALGDASAMAGALRETGQVFLPQSRLVEIILMRFTKHRRNGTERELLAFL